MCKEFKLYLEHFGVKKNGEKKTEILNKIAKITGYHPKTLYHIAAGRIQASPQGAVKLEEATGISKYVFRKGDGDVLWGCRKVTENDVEG